MDHLPLPKQQLPFSAPVRCLVKTHRINCDVFQQNIATRPLDLLRESMSYLSAEEWDTGDRDGFIGIIQDWLYFGLMAFAFRSFNTDDFKRTDANWGQVITSSKLPMYMAVWEQEMASLPRAKVSARVQGIAQAIKLVWTTCDQADFLECGDHLSHWLILFSIRVLVTSLGHMVQKLNSKLKTMEAFRLSTTKVVWPKLPQSYRPVAMLMAERGWCPAETVRMLRTYHCPTVWYLIGLKDHTPLCIEPSGCVPDPESSLGCVTRRMREIDYKAQHTTSGCMCEPIHADMDRVSAILRDGGLPLIRCTVTDCNEITLQVVRAKRNKTHIAISHVYFNGIGIPRQNLIFPCQLLSLFEYMQKVHEKCRRERAPWVMLPRSWHHARLARKRTLNFWIDIFCIPWSAPTEQELWSLRSKAISLIEPAFAGAYGLLIADTALRILCPQDKPLVEVSARVAISSWMTRSWTFLEASVKREVPAFVCLGRQIISLDKLQLFKPAKMVYDSSSRMIYEDLETNFTLFSALWCYDKKIIGSQVTFVMMWNVLADRTTSRPGDEWGILAVLLGYSMSEVLGLPEHDRPRAIFRSLSSLPASFLFKKVQRHQDPDDVRNSWIPKSIDHTIRDFEKSLPFTDQGIHVDHKIGMTLLLTTAEALPESFIVVSTPTAPKCIRITLHMQHQSSCANNAAEQAQYCLVLHAFGRQDNDFLGNETQGTRGEGACLLVLGSSQPDQGPISTEFRSSITWEAVHGTPDHHHEVSVTGRSIIILCDRSTWYQPKSTRQKNFIMLHRNAWLAWFALPYAALLVPACTLPALIPAFKSHSLKSALIVTAVAVATLLALVPLVWLTWQIDDLLYRNWVDSFQDRGKPKRWWKRIMP